MCVILSEAKNLRDSSSSVLGRLLRMTLINNLFLKLLDSQRRGMLCSAHKRAFGADIPLSMIKIGNPRQKSR